MCVLQADPNPVCDTSVAPDGKQYENSCEAGCKGVSLSTMEPMPCSEVDFD